MKKVFAREELCVNCHLCEVYCKTAHSKSKDVLIANKCENPAPVSKVTSIDRENKKVKADKNTKAYRRS